MGLKIYYDISGICDIDINDDNSGNPVSLEFCVFTQNRVL